MELFEKEAVFQCKSIKGSSHVNREYSHDSSSIGHICREACMEVVDPVGWGSATGLGRGGEGWGKDSMG